MQTHIFRNVLLTLVSIFNAYFACNSIFKNIFILRAFLMHFLNNFNASFRFWCIFSLLFFQINSKRFGRTPCSQYDLVKDELTFTILQKLFDNKVVKLILYLKSLDVRNSISNCLYKLSNVTNWFPKLYFFTAKEMTHTTQWMYELLSKTTCIKIGFEIS